MPNRDKKKVYTIQITGVLQRPNAWYAKRMGQQFEAELMPRYNSVLGMFVNRMFYVMKEDYKIVSEKTVNL